jgi:predicted XRE-type DNA-binding protein
MANRRFIELKKWLIEKELRQRDIAKKAGVSDTAVRNVMAGKMTSANIKRVFIEMGCPPEIWEEEVA